MRDAKKGTYNGDTTYCPVNAYGDCPYCDQCNVCHVDDPMEDCDDWGCFFESWDEWVSLDDNEDFDDSVDETGYNPYEGAYDYDC